MKYALLMLVCVSAFAEQSPRQMCLDALLEGYDSPVRETYNRNISGMSAEQVEALPAPIKAQLIDFAKQQAGPTPTPSCPVAITTVHLAVECVREMNESRDEEFSYTYLTALNGNRFNRITFYPGAQDGLIYADKTTTVVATISDGGVFCVD